MFDQLEVHSLPSTYHRLPIIRIRERYPDRLVDEENICIGVPRLRVVPDAISINYSTGPCQSRQDSIDKIYLTARVPSSMSSPLTDEAPGPEMFISVSVPLKSGTRSPPSVQNITSSLSGLFLLSKR
jgi:hypothetical protein